MSTGPPRTAGTIRGERIRWNQRRRARRIGVENERFVRRWKQSIKYRWTRRDRCCARLGCERRIVHIVVLLVIVRAHRGHALQRFLGNAHLLVEHLKEGFRCSVTSVEVPIDTDLNGACTLA